jgi:hypothetical protein
MRFTDAIYLQYADFLADYSAAHDKLSNNLSKHDFIAAVFAVLGSHRLGSSKGSGLSYVFYAASPDEIVRAYVLIDNVMIFDRDEV